MLTHVKLGIRVWFNPLGMEKDPAWDDETLKISADDALLQRSPASAQTPAMGELKTRQSM